METAPCRTIASIRAKNGVKATALGAEELRAGTVSFPLTIGPARCFGAVNMGLGSENPGFAKLENLFSSGALKGKAGMIVQTALDNDIDPNLFAAVIAHETGRGTSNAISNYNNPAGIMDPKTKWTKLKKFDSLEDGLTFSAKNLRKRLDQVGGDIDRLASLYAPVGAENDPSGLNKNWSTGVKKFMELLGPDEERDSGEPRQRDPFMTSKLLGGGFGGSGSVGSGLQNKTGVESKLQENMP